MSLGVIVAVTLRCGWKLRGAQLLDGRAEGMKSEDKAPRGGVDCWGGSC